MGSRGKLWYSGSVAVVACMAAVTLSVLPGHASSPRSVAQSGLAAAGDCGDMPDDMNSSSAMILLWEYHCMVDDPQLKTEVDRVLAMPPGEARDAAADPLVDRVLSDARAREAADREFVEKVLKTYDEHLYPEVAKTASAALHPWSGSGAKERFDYRKTGFAAALATDEAAMAAAHGGALEVTKADRALVSSVAAEAPGEFVRAAARAAVDGSDARVLAFLEPGWGDAEMADGFLVDAAAGDGEARLKHDVADLSAATSDLEKMAAPLEPVDKKAVLTEIAVTWDDVAERTTTQRDRLRTLAAQRRADSTLLARLDTPELAARHSSLAHDIDHMSWKAGEDATSLEKQAAGHQPEIEAARTQAEKFRDMAAQVPEAAEAQVLSTGVPERVIMLSSFGLVSHAGSLDWIKLSDVAFLQQVAHALEADAAVWPRSTKGLAAVLSMPAGQAQDQAAADFIRTGYVVDHFADLRASLPDVTEQVARQKLLARLGVTVPDEAWKGESPTAFLARLDAGVPAGLPKTHQVIAAGLAAEGHAHDPAAWSRLLSDISIAFAVEQDAELTVEHARYPKEKLVWQMCGQDKLDAVQGDALFLEGLRARCAADGPHHTHLLAALAQVKAGVSWEVEKFLTVDSWQANALDRKEAAQS